MSTTTATDIDQRAIEEAPLLSVLLTPGSSLHPTFILILDVALGSLAVLLLLLLYLSSGNRHFVGLLVVELSLWVTVKWFVNELRRANAENAENTIVEPTTEEKKEQ